VPVLVPCISCCDVSCNVVHPVYSDKYTNFVVCFNSVVVVLHIYGLSIYPRDPMLRVLAIAPCLCLSLVGGCSVETADQIGLVFSMGASFDLSYTLLRKFSIFKNKGTSLWNFAPNSGLRKFRHSISIVLST